jgi:hypothetical protein
MQAIETIDWFYRWKGAAPAFNQTMDGTGPAVLYGSDSLESNAMVKLLNELGVQFEYRSVNTDPAAMREWEQLDGEEVPLLRMGKNSIVRGFDRIKVQQLIGWVGC